jgi:hypothetical protein
VAAFETGGKHPACVVTLKTRVYVPGAVIEARSHVGTKPFAPVAKEQEIGVAPFTVTLAAVGCIPVAGYGSAVRVGAVQA